MRKSVIFFALANLPAIIAAQTFEVKYNLSDFTVTKSADSVVTVSTAHRSFYCGDSQSPQLPFLPANILCSQGTVECDPVFRYEKEPVATGVLLHTIPPLIPISIDIPEGDDTPQIARSSQTSPYHYKGVGKMMGYSFARIALSPFEYDYDTRTLYFIKSFVITLNEKVRQRAPSKSGTVAAEPLGDPKVISDIVLNSKELSSMYQPVVQKQNRDIFRKGMYGEEDSTSNNEGVLDGEMAELYTVDYLIVTSENLKPAFEKLAQWKSVRGLNTKIVTVDNLTPFQIKEMISEYYERFYTNWVLLAGDEENVPVKNSIGLDGDSAACDIYYACFSNDFVSNYYDGKSLDPDVYLSRLSVRTLEQANAIVDKIIQYEQREIIEPISKKPLFFGVTTNPNISDRYYTNKIMDIIDPQYDDDSFYYCFEWQNNINLVTTTSNDVSKNFKTILSSDYGIIHIDSHGTEKTMSSVHPITGAEQIFYNINFINNFESISNSNPYIIVTNACLTNNFSSNVEPCISEALMRKSLSDDVSGAGAIAYFGPSSYGAKTEYDAIADGSYLYSAYFLRSIIKNQTSIGEALTVSKVTCADYIYNNDYNNIYYSLYRTTNLLGDPELHYYSELLPKIAPEVLRVTDDTVSICLPEGQYGDVVVALYDHNNVAGYFARKTGHAGDTVSFSVSCLKDVSEPYALRLVVSKNGYTPYIQELFQCKILGDVVLNNNTDGRFSIQNLPEIYLIRWDISNKYNSESMIRNYFSLSNDEDSVCNVAYNQVVSQEIYGIEKTTLSAQIYTFDIFREYIQPVDGIDVVYLGEFEGDFTQEGSGDYPGISNTKISAKYLNSNSNEEPGIEVPDSGLIELSDAHIKMSLRQMNELTSHGVSPITPIFVYPHGTVVLRSEFFKYLSYESNASSANTSVDFSKYNDGEIRFEMGELNEVLSFKFERGGNVSDVYLNFVSVEFDSPSLVCIDANNSNGIQMGLYSPEDMRSGSWVYEVYDASTAMLVHSETATYSSSYTISYKPILNHSYVITARNSDNNISLTTRFIANF